MAGGVRAVSYVRCFSVTLLMGFDERGVQHRRWPIVTSPSRSDVFVVFCSVKWK